MATRNPRDPNLERRWRDRIVPGRIVVAFVAELTLYGFACLDGPFPNFLRILERPGATKLCRSFREF
jgi:hypothetical protein